MKTDDLSCLCAELALPVVEETAEGVEANEAARRSIRDGEVSLTAAALAIAGGDELPGELMKAIAAGRRGERCSVTVANGAGPAALRVLVTPAATAGCARLVFAASAHDGRATPAGLLDVAAAVSHEVANAVGSIRGWAELALHKSDAVVDVHHALTLIRAAARSAEQAARSMLAIARGQVDESGERSSNLTELAGELLQLLTLTARQSRVTLESALAPDLCVGASRAQLFTILFNLVKNGIEACPPGGLVSVHLEGDDRQVKLWVRDTGRGLDNRAKERLFERYYTTKRTGTGLGLSLVRDAVHAAGAQLDVESSAGCGATFQVVFPRLRAALPRAASRVEPRTTPEQGSQNLHARVLVVDDDQALREMLTTALTLRGAEVVGVRSADEALTLAGTFDIALIDMMLDGCRGDELLSRLRQRGMVQAAMLVTGTVQRPRLVPGGEPDDWVRKPFEIPHLLERIRRTLERHQMLHEASTPARM